MPAKAGNATNHFHHLKWQQPINNALFCWDRQLPLCYHFLCLTILSAASLNSILINWSLKNMLNYQIIKFYTVSVWTIQKNYFDKKCCQIKTNITHRSASQHHKKQYVRLWNKSTGLKKINWEIEMNKEIVFSEGLFPPGKLWSHTPTNQTKQSSSGSCHLNSGFEQLINKAGQNLTPVTYTLDSYVLLLVCPPHLKKLEKSGKLDQWCLKNSIYSLWRDCHVWDRCNNTRIFDQIISGTEKEEIISAGKLTTESPFGVFPICVPITSEEPWT